MLSRADARNNEIYIFPHWTNDGVIDWPLQLPAAPEGKKLVLHFNGLIPHPGNACNLAVRVNGKEVLRDALVGKDRQAKAETVDLTPWAGQTVLLSLYLEKCGFFDWFHVQDGVIVSE